MNSVKLKPALSVRHAVPIIRDISASLFQIAGSEMNSPEGIALREMTNPKHVA